MLWLRYGGENILSRHAAAEFCSLLVTHKILDSLTRNERRTMLNSICTILIDSNTTNASSKAIEFESNIPKLTNQPKEREYLVSYLILAARLSLYCEKYESANEWIARQENELGRQNKKEEDERLVPQVEIKKEIYGHATITPVFEKLSLFCAEYDAYCQAIKAINLEREELKKEAVKGAVPLRRMAELLERRK